MTDYVGMILKPSLGQAVTKPFVFCISVMIKALLNLESERIKTELS
jgi:hypothetical protein